MAAGLLIIPNYMPAEDANGSRLPGALIYTYEDGTTTPKVTYTDAALTIPHPNPIQADSSGNFAPIWADNDTLNRFTLTVTTSGGAPLAAYDGVRASVPITTLPGDQANVAITGGTITGLTGFAVDPAAAEAARASLGVGLALLTTGSLVSAASTYDIPISAGTGSKYLIIIENVEASVAGQINLQLDMGSGVVTSAVYAYSNSVMRNGNTIYNNSISATSVFGLGNAPLGFGSGLKIDLSTYKGSGSSHNTVLNIDGNYVDGSGFDAVAKTRAHVGSSSTRATSLRLAPASGNLTRLSWALYQYAGL